MASFEIKVAVKGGAATQAQAEAVREYIEKWKAPADEEPLVLRPVDALFSMTIDGIGISLPDVVSVDEREATVRARMFEADAKRFLDFAKDKLRSAVPVEIGAKGKRRAALLRRVCGTVGQGIFDILVSFAWTTPPPVPKPKASAPEKPVRLAARQTWEDAFGNRIELTRTDGRLWYYLEDGEERHASEPWIRSLCYLGTREDVAAREGKAAASAPVAPREMPRQGSRSWFVQEIAHACDAARQDVTIHDPPPGEDGTIEVDVRGCPPAKVAEAIAAIRHDLPLGLDIRAHGFAKPDPYPNAALHKAIDAAIAADFGPFAHARAAALRAWSETDAPAWVTATPRELLVMLRVYESIRGGQRTPSAAATRRTKEAPSGLGETVIAVYERERSPVHRRRGR